MKRLISILFIVSSVMTSCSAVATHAPPVAKAWEIKSNTLDKNVCAEYTVKHAGYMALEKKSPDNYWDRSNYDVKVKCMFINAELPKAIPTHKVFVTPYKYAARENRQLLSMRNKPSTILENFHTRGKWFSYRPGIAENC